MNGVWDRFVSNHHSGTIFHTTAWLHVLATTQSVRVLRLGFYRGNELCAVMPLLVRCIWPLSVAASPFIVEDTPYLGMVADDGDIFHVLEVLSSFLKHRGIHFVRIIQRNAILTQDAPAGFKLIEKHTHVLNLCRSEDEIWNQMEGKCRTHIRKAIKSGVSIEMANSRSCLDAYYEMLRQLYAKQGMTNVNGSDFYLKLWDLFSPDKLFLILARIDNELIAGAIIVCDHNRWYYLNGASRSDYNHLSPSNLLQWEAIRMARSRGGLQYDFVGSDIERLAKFKKTFGGDLVTYSCLEHATYPIVECIRDRYPQFKSIVGKVKNKLNVLTRKIN